ncbi:MAG: hypothetical protein M3440_07295 [Chloroflexota bacterium]|nr:hypothetical protein [Chloroflexota bacterium]
MPDITVQLPPNSTGQKLRFSDRGTAGADQYVIPTSARNVSNTGLVTTWRTIGAAALTQNLFAISNASGSTTLVAVRRVTAQLDHTAILAAVMPQIKAFRITAGIAAGGTLLDKKQLDTTEVENASVTVRGATASDGGAATAITGTLDTGALWQQFGSRMHTAVGQILGNDNNVIPGLTENDPIILRANQALVVQVVASPATSNPATNHWFVQCVWDEFTS